MMLSGNDKEDTCSETGAVFSGCNSRVDFSTSESGCQALFWKISTPLKLTL